MAQPYHRDFSAPVAEAVTNGKFNLGIYNQPLQKNNLIDAKSPYTFLPKYMRLKEWQAFQLGNEDWFIMVAIYSAKTMALAQFIVFDIKNNKKVKYERKLPLWKIHVAQSLCGTESWYDGKGFKLKAKNDAAKGTIDIEVDIKNFEGGLPDLKGNFTGLMTAGQVQPQAVVLPFNEKRAMYSLKCLMHMQGQLLFGDNLIRFDAPNSHLIMDDHKGYYPYVMKYGWVTGAGFDSSHRLVGFNLTDNQIINKEIYNENCLWVDDKITLLPAVKVTWPNGVEGEWVIKDDFGRVDVTFAPVVNTRVDVNALIIRSDYHGPYGYYHGFILDTDDNRVGLEGLFGMGEQFYLRA